MTDIKHSEDPISPEVSHSAREDARGYTLLRETSRLISSAPRVEVLLELLHEEIQKLFPADTYFVTLYDDATNEVSVEILIDEGQAVPRARHRLKGGLVKWVIDNQRPLLIRDLERDTPPVPPVRMGKETVSRSWLGVPMLLSGKVIGVLVVASCEPDVYDEEDQDILFHVASQAAVAIANARLYEEAQCRVRELDALQAVSLELLSSLNLSTVLELVARTALELTHATDVHIFLYDRQNDRLDFGASLWATGQTGLLPETTPRPDGITMTAIKSGQPVVIDDCESHPLFADPERRVWGLEAIASLPLKRADDVLGALNVAFLEPHGFDDEELRLLNLLASQAAVAIANARLYSDLEEAFDQLRKSQARLAHAERIRALAELSAGVAHDFNNVLTSILGRVQLLLLDVKDPGLRESLQVVEQAARNGAQIVRRIMGFARHRGREPYSPEDVNRVVEDAILLTQPRWRTPASDGTVISLEFEKGHVEPVWASSAEITEVLTNLIFNAVDAMPRGGKICIATRQENDEAVIEVGDTGVGMPEAVMEKIFTPFFTTKGTAGAGMGLSVAREIITRHGGDIQVESRLGEGSKFTIHLPSARDVQLPQSEEGLRMKEIFHKGKSISILVIEDEESIRRLLASILGMEGHDVRSSSNAADGLAHFRERVADLVITDLGLPDQSGWEVARQVKMMAPGTPVILITGWGVSAEVTEARRRGVDYVLPKPFEFEDLSELISKALSNLEQE